MDAEEIHEKEREMENHPSVTPTPLSFGKVLHDH